REDEGRLDAGLAQRLHHVEELVDRTERMWRGAVALVGREERDWRIPPVVHQAGGRVLCVELEHRQELPRADAELLQVGNLFDEAGVRATDLLREVGARVAGEAAEMQLVNAGRVPCSA